MAIYKTKLPISYDFIFRQDETFRFTYRVKNPDGTAMNNTGWQVDMDIRLTPNEAAIVRLSTVTGEIVLGGVTGLVTITFSKADVAILTPGLFLTDIRETYFDTTATYRFKGSVSIEEMITHE